MDNTGNNRRDLIFVSHANPEDNEFARWVTLQLAKDGYPVWCDLTQFLGGEHFWESAEEAIRTRSIRFLYVLSRCSNHKEGPRNELQIAANVERVNPGVGDFIIPLHIDSLPYSDINVQLASRIAISFEHGWAAGYDQLLERFEKHGVPRRADFNAQAVNEWWRKKFSANKGVTANPEPTLSNWLPIISIPETLYFHGIKRYGIGLMELQEQPSFPAFIDSAELVTFAPVNEFEDKLPGFSILGSRSLNLSEANVTDMQHLNTILARLLRLAWESALSKAGLGHFTLADGAKCFFHRKPQTADNLYLPVPNIFGSERRPRAVVGYSTGLEQKRRYWHFAIQGKPILHPKRMFSVTNHVVFSDDGRKVWTDSDKMHKARRRQCKMWQNDEWRDRMLAMLGALPGPDAVISLAVAPHEGVLVSRSPMLFESPVKFVDPVRNSRAVPAGSEHAAILPLPNEEDLADDADLAGDEEEDIDPEVE